MCISIDSWSSKNRVLCANLILLFALLFFSLWYTIHDITIFFLLLLLFPEPGHISRDCTQGGSGGGGGGNFSGGGRDKSCYSCGVSVWTSVLFSFLLQKHTSNLVTVKQPGTLNSVYTTQRARKYVLVPFFLIFFQRLIDTLKNKRTFLYVQF